MREQTEPAVSLAEDHLQEPYLYQMTAGYADYMLEEALDFNLRTMSLEELAKLVAEKIKARKRDNVQQ